MSGNVNVLEPNRRVRRRQRMLPQDVLEWKAHALQALGWNSKTAEQTNTFNAMDESCQIIRNSAMRGQGKFGATSTLDLRKDSGKEFKAYHDKLKEFEGAEPRTPQLVDELKATAQGYIDHFNQHSKKQQQNPKNISKKEACEATLKELYKFDLAEQVDGLGAPPWDNVQSMQAASLKTALAISSLPRGERRAENLGGGHESPAFWINERNDQGGKSKTFIFKPSAKSGQLGFPDGGEPGREAMGGRMADMLNGALGLSLPVPETQVVSVGKESLPQESIDNLVANEKIKSQDNYVGSVQQFEATQGEMRAMTLADREQIPTQAAQELAIFDTILLNTDRHEGNFLMKPGNGGGPELVPIDHGLTLPTRESSDAITNNIGSTHNALMTLPGSHQPFTQQAQQSLAQLDPDALAQAMKNERATLEQAHPSLAGTVSDEAIELSRRSAMFLKRAATRLTPAAVQVGISRFHKELFAPELDMNTFNDVADQIIDELEDQQDAIAEYFQMPKEMQKKMKDDLASKGWDTGRFQTGNSILTNPEVALRIWKSGIQAPDGKSNPNRRPADIDDQTPNVLEQVQEAFPKLKIPDDNDRKRNILDDWRDFNNLGGKDALREAIGLVGVRGDNVTTAYEDLGKAVFYLRRADGLKQALANDNTNVALVDIQHSIEYIQSILPALDPATRGNAVQAITPIQNALGGQQPMDGNAQQQALTTLGQLRKTLTDAARTRLLQKFDTYIAGQQDDRAKERAKEVQSEVRAFAITYGYEELSRLDQALADAP